jgi:hypothetical protein
MTSRGQIAWEGVPTEMLIHWLRNRVFALASVATDDYDEVPWEEQDVVEILDHALWLLDQHLTLTRNGQTNGVL